MRKSRGDAQLTRHPCFILKRKSVVARKPIEGDRLVSGEPLDVVHHETRFSLAIETLQVEKSFGRPFRRAGGQETLLQFGRWQQADEKPSFELDTVINAWVR